MTINGFYDVIKILMEDYNYIYVVLFDDFFSLSLSFFLKAITVLPLTDPNVTILPLITWNQVVRSRSAPVKSFTRKVFTVGRKKIRINDRLFVKTSAGYVFYKINPENVKFAVIIIFKI